MWPTRGIGDSGLGYFVGQALSLFSVEFRHGVTILKAWTVSPEWRNWERTEVISINAIVRSAHLDDLHPDFWKAYFVNYSLDADMFRRLPMCTEDTFVDGGYRHYHRHGT
ncbi:hypothetical protein M427DRAFT_139152 [Gonapodya prolifera JEL478]|uniref:Uncharacterized protein n=1 Tax=Gonapodya prolifera (strain JEL478) TaxID=1344416 RepID=A0A139A2E5_GONPJ|nr:hypothetical protein M427DRAFT_139152 [Gonapodya prolifera JEL478]|eukprot:KXS10523.1 hypothetical protein M427DRAFT_139152 [Gonapodya prolifera JEL478]